MTAALTDKAWRTIAARAALVGLQIFRSHPADGPQRLLLERNGQWHEIKSIDQLEDLVVCTAGA